METIRSWAMAVGVGRQWDQQDSWLGGIFLLIIETAVPVDSRITVGMIIPNHISKSHIIFRQVKSPCGCSHGKKKKSICKQKWDTVSNKVKIYCSRAPGLNHTWFHLHSIYVNYGICRVRFSDAACWDHCPQAILGKQILLWALVPLSHRPHNVSIQSCMKGLRWNWVFLSSSAPNSGSEDFLGCSRFLVLPLIYTWPRTQRDVHFFFWENYKDS